MKHVLLRVLRSMLMVWLTMTCVFLLAQFGADPARLYLGAQARAVQLAEFRHAHGLDRSWWRQYWDLMSFRVGSSYRLAQPVSELLALRLPRTMLLGVLALTMEFVVALAIGMLGARGRGFRKGVADASVSLGASVPGFVLGVLLLQFVALRAGFFPVGGMGVGLMDRLHHALLPALTLGILGGLHSGQVFLTQLRAAGEQDFVRTARALGFSETRAFLRYTVPYALPSLFNMVALSIPWAITGAMITETVFGWPGMGRLALDAISGGDLPVLYTVVFVGAVSVQLANAVADAGVNWLDPRTRPS